MNVNNNQGIGLPRQGPTAHLFSGHERRRANESLGHIQLRLRAMRAQSTTKFDRRHSIVPILNELQGN